MNLADYTSRSPMTSPPNYRPPPARPPPPEPEGRSNNFYPDGRKEQLGEEKNRPASPAAEQVVELTASTLGPRIIEGRPRSTGESPEEESFHPKFDALMSEVKGSGAAADYDGLFDAIASSSAASGSDNDRMTSSVNKKSTAAAEESVRSWPRSPKTPASPVGSLSRTPGPAKVHISTETIDLMRGIPVAPERKHLEETLFENAFSEEAVGQDHVDHRNPATSSASASGGGRRSKKKSASSSSSQTSNSRPAAGGVTGKPPRVVPLREFNLPTGSPAEKKESLRDTGMRARSTFWQGGQNVYSHRGSG